MSISNSSRTSFRERARFLCEYCHSSEEAGTALFDIDHIIPKSLGGADELDNLALACQRCNSYRYNFLAGIDPQKGSEVKLFNPRTQQWSEHFIWSVDGQRIVGKTAVGRATCDLLDLNDDLHNDGFILKARQFWIRGGWHTPADDLQEN